MHLTRDDRITIENNLNDNIPLKQIGRNINKQIRKFFPKGQSVDIYSKKDVIEKNLILLRTPIKSLDGNTPSDAFKAVYGEDLFY